jgi:hypothetical protein
MEHAMRTLRLATLLIPLALAACGSDKTVVVNPSPPPSQAVVTSPPAQTVITPPSQTVVTPQPGHTVVVPQGGQVRVCPSGSYC